MKCIDPSLKEIVIVAGKPDRPGRGGEPSLYIRIDYTMKWRGCHYAPEEIRSFFKKPLYKRAKMFIIR
jgi:hypothetical protein